MRDLSANELSMYEALAPAAATLDRCWWYLGGPGFSITPDFKKRLYGRQWSQAQIQKYWENLVEKYVDSISPFGRVGKPGFFSALSDSVDFSWAHYYALESETFPAGDLAALDSLESSGMDWFSPIIGLPKNVVLVARDVDAAYQDYGLRDARDFIAIRDHHRLRATGVTEVTEWPNAAKRM